VRTLLRVRRREAEATKRAEEQGKAGKGKGLKAKVRRAQPKPRPERPEVDHLGRPMVLNRLGFVLQNLEETLARIGGPDDLVRLARAHPYFLNAAQVRRMAELLAALAAAEKAGETQP
jgi:hypothetical protein